jgi:hypothetical protein
MALLSWWHPDGEERGLLAVMGEVGREKTSDREGGGKAGGAAFFFFFFFFTDTDLSLILSKCKCCAGRGLDNDERDGNCLVSLHNPVEYMTSRGLSMPSRLLSTTQHGHC